MSTPTRKEIIEAYREIDMLLGHYDDRNPYRVPECRAIIEKALPPRPQPTMADVEWDDDKHYLAEAEHADWGTMTMLKPMRTYPQIKCLSTKGGDYCIVYPSTEDLIPTGRRYTLTEVQE